MLASATSCRPRARPGGVEPGDADDRVQDEVCARLGGQRRHPVTPGQHGPVEAGLAPGGGRILAARSPARRATWPRRPARHVGRRRASPQAARLACASITSSACRPIEPVAPSSATRRTRPTSAARPEPGEVGGRRGEEQRVHAVEHAAVPAEQRPRVLDARVALEERLEQVAERPGQRRRERDGEGAVRCRTGCCRASPSRRRRRTRGRSRTPRPSCWARWRARGAGARRAVRRSRRRCPRPRRPRRPPARA